MRFRLTCSCRYGIYCYSRPLENKTYLYYRCITDRKGDTAKSYCGLPSFRVDRVDGIIWNWLKSWFKDPDDLHNKLEAYKAECDRVNAPLLTQLAVNDDLLAENQAQRDRLIQLYQAGIYDLETTAAHKTKLDETIKGLEQERAKLAAQLGKGLSQDQITEIVVFARELSKGLAKAKSFEARRNIIELLDVRGILAIEDGEQIVHA
jgi:hypothetical protein